MDLEILFWIIILVVPLLSRLLRGKQRKGGAPPAPPQRSVPRPQESRTRELTPFEEALRQIQEALAEGRTAETQPEPRAQPKPQPRPLAPPRLEKRPVDVRPPKPVAAKPRFFDDKFDAAAPGMAPGAKEHYHEPLGEDIPAIAFTTRTRRRRKLTEWQKVVTNAVLIGEPRSRKPWSPGRQ